VSAAERRWDIVVVGGANWDFLVRGPKLPAPGGTVSGDDFQEAPGGKGANQAVAAARLGARVALVARVGTDAYGTRILERLRAEGVGVDRVARDDHASTGIALIQVGGDGEKQILTAPGANTRLSIADVDASRSIMERAAVLLVQLEPPVQVVDASVRIAHEAGARVVLDPAPPPAAPLTDALLRHVDLVRPNSEEAAALTGVRVHDRDSARVAANALVDRGIHTAVVQAGSSGDLMVWHAADGRRECWLPHFDVRSIDATGAGDAFAAALAVMLAERRPLADAGRFASAAAALTTTRLGAQAALPTRDDVDLFLREVARPAGAPLVT
jgi:ribokinase